MSEIPDKVYTASALWIAGHTPPELAAGMACNDSKHALQTIVRYRRTYGIELFPHRKPAVAEGGYSRALVLKLSKMWKSKAPHEAISAELRCENPESAWGIINHLRARYGASMFPHRRKLDADVKVTRAKTVAKTKNVAKATPKPSVKTTKSKPTIKAKVVAKPKAKPAAKPKPRTRSRV